MLLEGKNKDCINDLGVKSGIDPRDEFHVNHEDYTYMNLKDEDKHE